KVPIADAEQQWRESRVRLRLHIGSGVEQQLDSAGIPFRGGPHQSRLAPDGFLCISVCSVREEYLHSVNSSIERRRHERGLAFFGSIIRAGSCLQQTFDNRGVSIDAGER